MSSRKWSILLGLAAIAVKVIIYVTSSAHTAWKCAVALGALLLISLV